MGFTHLKVTKPLKGSMLIQSFNLRNYLLLLSLIIKNVEWLISFFVPTSYQVYNLGVGK